MKNVCMALTLTLLVGSSAHATGMKRPLLNCGPKEKIRAPLYQLTELSHSAPGGPISRGYVLEQFGGFDSDTRLALSGPGVQVSVQGEKIKVVINRGRSGSGKLEYDRAKRRNTFELNNLQVQLRDGGVTGWDTGELHYRCFPARGE